METVNVSKEPWILTLGETMLRLSPKYEGDRLLSAKDFRVEPGGSESNVASALAGLGHRVRHLTKVPANALGDMVIRKLREEGVNVDYVYRSSGRIGCYWTEIGLGPRPSRVIYDRVDSLFSNWLPNEVDWDQVFTDVVWLHSSGITPAVSPTARDFLLQAIDSALAGTIISIDLNYRNKLWGYLSENREEQIHKIMERICSRCHYVFGNESDFEDCLGIPVSDSRAKQEKYQSVASAFFERFKNSKGIAVSSRVSINASENDWTGFLFLKKKGSIERYCGPTYRITDIVDRLGAGDAFAGGLISARTSGTDWHGSLRTANANGAIVVTKPGCANFMPTEEETATFMKSRGGI